MANNIIQAVLDYRYVDTRSVWQYDYGQVLRIKGENLPRTAEVHFSLNEVGGDSVTKVGIATDEMIEVQVPDELLENGGTRFKYNIYAFVYIEDGTSGNTEYRIRIPVQTRPKPSDHVTPDNTDTDPFGDAVKAVNGAAERAATSERNAKASEDAAAESAKNAANSVTELDTATKEALKSIEDKKIECVNSVEKQKESSVQSVTEHTDSEIQRMTQRANEVGTSLGESIAEGMQLNKDIFASGQKAVSDINSASTQALSDINTTGVEKLDAVNKAAEAIVADREQITKNKTDIALLNEDVVDLKDKKITKFYASNQGETHLADSDKGLMQDMHIYGKSEQKQYNGYQVFNPNVYPEKFALQACEVTNENGVFKFFGEVSNYAVKWVKTELLPAGTYFANCKISDSISPSFRIYFVRNGKEIYIENNEPFTLDGTETEFQYGIGHTLPGGATLTGQTLTPSIVRGDSAQPYEPYTGGKPSPSPDYPQDVNSVVNPVVKIDNNGYLQKGSYFKDIRPLKLEKGKTYFIRSTVNYFSNLNACITDEKLNFRDSNKVYNYCHSFSILKNGEEVVGKCRLLQSAGSNNIIYSFSVMKNNLYLYQGVNDAIKNVDDFWISYSEDSIDEPYKEQSITLPYTLNAIPVTSGGNVTIDGQQYISDYVDVERGKLVRIVDSFKLDNTQSIIGKTECLLAEPQETDLTKEEITAFKALVTYYPTTNISVNSEQLDGYTVFNYPISMANGWNYVKQQLNDNRDYIYDMDLQSAEAYVNSEYAVALTELEV